MISPELLKARPGIAPTGERWIPPREWSGERCFIICGGPSVKDQKKAIRALKGRIIVIKQSVLLRPDADVMFTSGKDDPIICAPFFPKFRGTYLVARGPHIGLPAAAKCLRRPKDHDRLALEPGCVSGLDAGTSAINLAFHFGADEIVMLGFDMTGGRWFNGEIKHHMPFPPQAHFDRHLKAASEMAKDLTERGVKVWNASPISAATFFEYRPLGEFL